MKVFNLVVLNLVQYKHVSGFAGYAPNFITKQIDTSFSSEENPEEFERIKGAKNIQTRFPPEPNGYLHLGHAKAINFNFNIARAYNGKCNLRMDDTNPSKEDEEYVQSIIEDVNWIQSDLGFLDEDKGTAWSGEICYTSNYFEDIYDCAVSLIRSGDAYVDSLTADEVREYRGTLNAPGCDSPYRTRTIEENVELFKEMREGKHKDGTLILRAKIDMSSPNMNLRDPALYRIKHESHPNTGDDWCIYPMYDFSHPISDAMENITHSLCTLEFEDHRPFYDWTINKLASLTTKFGIVPRQMEFSRLNIGYIVLSKRKLITLVQENKVTGWDDPRMPTLSGLRRRGVPPSAIRLFCERVGISKSDALLDYTEFENCIREVMDDSSTRAFAILDPLNVTITNYNVKDLPETDLTFPKHPKKEELGERAMQFTNKLYIDKSDFFDTKDNTILVPKGYKRLTEGGYIRLKMAYVLHCHKVIRDETTNEVIELLCDVLPDSFGGQKPENVSKKQIKGILHWLDRNTAIPTTFQLFDRLFSNPEPGKNNTNFLDELNPNSLIIKKGYVEPSVGMYASGILSAIDKLQKQEQQQSNNDQDQKLYHSNLNYQFERTGYYALDSSTTRNHMVFNRVTTLRDTWNVPDKKPNSKVTTAPPTSSPPRRRGVKKN